MRFQIGVRLPHQAVDAFSVPKLVESVSNGFIAVYFPETNLIMTITIPSYEVRINVMNQQ